MLLGFGEVFHLLSVIMQKNKKINKNAVILNNPVKTSQRNAETKTQTIRFQKQSTQKATRIPFFGLDIGNKE